MSALTDRIAHDHEPMLVGGAYQCSCGEEAPLHYFDKYRDLSECHRAHTNAVIESAVREQVAQDIEDARSQAPAWVAESHLSTWQAALAHAARIANGEQP